jgi:peptide/nickel transport system permease protein
VARYILRRLALLPLLLVGVSLLLFVITHLIPADPAKLIAGPHAGPEQIAEVRRVFGLDRPLPVQYLVFLAGLARGDLGTSIQTDRPVAADLREYFPATFELTAAAMVATIAIGVPLGVAAAIRRGGVVDLVAQLLGLSGLSFPIFFFGLVMQLLFSRWLGWLPLGGRIGPDVTAPAGPTGLYLVDALVARDAAALASALHYLVLPALTLTLAVLALVVRITRSSMLEVLSQDFIRTARAKGLVPFTVYLRHGLRNALIPVVTVMGLFSGGLLGGVFLVELIFAWPGVGLYSVDAILALDYPAIMGTALLVTVVYIIVSLLVDVAYALLDPRIRY